MSHRLREESREKGVKTICFIFLNPVDHHLSGNVKSGSRPQAATPATVNIARALLGPKSGLTKEVQKLRLALGVYFEVF